MLLWIGIKLLLPDHHKGQDIDGAASVMGAIKTIIVADFVMSLDNIVGVAGASHGSIPLLVFGLVVSIPIIVFASQLIMKAMERLPVIVVAGAGLLGWVAGGMIAGDPVIEPMLAGADTLQRFGLQAVGAGFVVVLGGLIARRRARAAYRRIG